MTTKHLFQAKDKIFFTMPLFGEKIMQGVVLSSNETDNMGVLVNVFVVTDSVGLIQINERFLKKLLQTRIAAVQA